MCNLKTGARVVVIDGYTNAIRKGVVSTVYENMEIAIVHFDDGDVEKVHFSHLGIEADTKAQEEEPTEPVEKSEITITPDEFRDITSKVIAQEAKKIGEGGVIVTLAFTAFAVELHKALFLDGVNND